MGQKGTNGREKKPRPPRPRKVPRGEKGASRGETPQDSGAQTSEQANQACACGHCCRSNRICCWSSRTCCSTCCSTCCPGSHSSLASPGHRPSLSPRTPRPHRASSRETSSGGAAPTSEPEECVRVCESARDS